MGVRTWTAALVLLLLPLLSEALSAQVTFSWGPRVGVVVSTMVFDDPATDSQTEPMLGLQVGASVRRDVGRLFDVEASVLFSREGFTGAGAHTGDLQRDQVVVPVTVSVRTPTRLSGRLSLGAAAKVALGCRLGGVPDAGSVGCGDPVLGAPWGTLDVAAIGALGVSVPWAGRSLSADARVSWGLRDLDGGRYIPGGAHSLTVDVSVAVFIPWRSAPAGGGA